MKNSVLFMVTSFQRHIRFLVSLNILVFCQITCYQLIWKLVWCGPGFRWLHSHSFKLTTLKEQSHVLESEASHFLFQYGQNLIWIVVRCHYLPFTFQNIYESATSLMQVCTVICHMQACCYIKKLYYIITIVTQ